MGAVIKPSEIQSRFDLIEDFSEEYRDWGYMALPISGHFIRNQVDLDAFVFVLKAILPSDVRLVVIDGISLRITHPQQDTYLMVFGSKTWPQVAEGAQLPRLEPIFLDDYVTGNPVYDMRVISTIPVGIGVWAKINKRTHKLLIRGQEETEEDVIIRITPLDAE